MKKFSKKSLMLLIAVTLLLTCTVSGTVAFLTVGSGPVTNTFTPVQVDTKIVENVQEVNGIQTKSSIQVLNKNLSTNIPAYVRVAIYGNWVDAAGRIIAPWSGMSSYNTEHWTKVGNYYYYNGELAVGATTENLLAADAPIREENKPEGVHRLEVTVVHQAIQSQPADAVKNAWGWTPPTTAQ